MNILTEFRQFFELQSSYRTKKGLIDSNHASFLKNRSLSIVWNSEKRKIFIYVIYANSQISRSIASLQ